MIVEALPENLFREPVDLLFADHYRVRLVCDHVDQLALEPDAPETPDRARAAADFLQIDLPRHRADELEDLLPQLQACCEADGIATSALAILANEHRRDEELLRDLLPGLNRVAAGQRPDSLPSLSRLATAFTATMRSHLAWEERVILPLARRRLSTAHAEAIGRRMAARRGVAYPER